VLDAANECLGRFDTRPADDRWCDALLQVIHLAQLSALLSPGRTKSCRCLQPPERRSRSRRGLGPRQTSVYRSRWVRTR
jgi:hypothetical protein